MTPSTTFRRSYTYVIACTHAQVPIESDRFASTGHRMHGIRTFVAPALFCMLCASSFLMAFTLPTRIIVSSFARGKPPQKKAKTDTIERARMNKFLLNHAHKGFKRSTVVTAFYSQYTNSQGTDNSDLQNYLNPFCTGEVSTGFTDPRTGLMNFRRNFMILRQFLGKRRNSRLRSNFEYN